MGFALCARCAKQPGAGTQVPRALPPVWPISWAGALPPRRCKQPGVGTLGPQEAYWPTFFLSLGSSRSPSGPCFASGRLRHVHVCCCHDVLALYELAGPFQHCVHFAHSLHCRPGKAARWWPNPPCFACFRPPPPCPWAAAMTCRATAGLLRCLCLLVNVTCLALSPVHLVPGHHSLGACTVPALWSLPLASWAARGLLPPGSSPTCRGPAGPRPVAPVGHLLRFAPHLLTCTFWHCLAASCQ